MASFQEARDVLVFEFAEGNLQEEEFLLLWDLHQSRNPPYPYWKYEKFDLEEMSETECKSNFRFEKRDIAVLADALRLPERFTCTQGTKVDGIEGLYLLLRRFSYPCRYSDIMPQFGRPVPEISLITSRVMDFIYTEHGHHLTSFDQPFLRPDALQQYCDAIHAKGAALNNCWGFVDGTVRVISHPGENQRVLYNGHKRVHALNFQSVASPNGLIANLFGPFEGKRHDAGMLAESGLLNQLEQFSFSPQGYPLCIYGDQAYPLRVHLQTPFRNVNLTPQMEHFNASMSTVRVSVEWLFGDMTNYFKFLDFKKNLKIGMSAVGKMYIVCSLLQNAFTCLYGNTTSDFFDLQPPTIYDYFGN